MSASALLKKRKRSSSLSSKKKVSLHKAAIVQQERKHQEASDDDDTKETDQDENTTKNPIDSLVHTSRVAAAATQAKKEQRERVMEFLRQQPDSTIIRGKKEYKLVSKRKLPPWNETTIKEALKDILPEDVSDGERLHNVYLRFIDVRAALATTKEEISIKDVS